MWERKRDPEGLLKTTSDRIQKVKRGFGFDRQRWIGWNEKPNCFRSRHRGDQPGKNKNNEWKRCYKLREKIGGKKLLITAEWRKRRWFFFFHKWKVESLNCVFLIKRFIVAAASCDAEQTCRWPNKNDLHDFVFRLWSRLSPEIKLNPSVCVFIQSPCRLNRVH